MGYLITHIAICLSFTMLLGLLLGWLLWGFAARQRGKEVQMLRERLADTHLITNRLTLAQESRIALPDMPEAVPTAVRGSFIDNELPARPTTRRVFFEEDDVEDLDARPVTFSAPVFIDPPPIAPDLEAQVKDAKIQHLQQQLRELEGFRDRLPLLQADLSDTIAARRAAEAKFQEAKNDFEVRSSSLLSQIRDFETAAAEWDKHRDQFEADKLAHEKELSSVHATLRDLQNSQRPQTVDAPPSASAVELADLRERYQKAAREREALAAELEFWKTGKGAKPEDTGRISELEESVRAKDEQLAQQAARVESLLWRVAELEPFAAEAPEKEEGLRRQESEIAGHMAMHSENAERIRSLQAHIAELQAATIPSTELKRIVAEHQTELKSLTETHSRQLAELKQAVSMKDDEISEHVSARYDQINLLNSLQARIVELEAATQKMKALEQQLTERDTEVRALLAAHSDAQKRVDAALAEGETWKTRAAELEPLANKAPDLESALLEHAAQLQQLKDQNSDKDGQLTFLQERLSAVSSLLATQHQQLTQLDQTLTEREQAAHQQIKALEDHHTTELTRLKVNSAQRLRRLRQSITTFKA
jgi:chromosome segregation ATPase